MADMIELCFVWYDMIIHSTSQEDSEQKPMLCLWCRNFVINRLQYVSLRRHAFITHLYRSSKIGILVRKGIMKGHMNRQMKP